MWSYSPLSSLVCKIWEWQWSSSHSFSLLCFSSNEQTVFTIVEHFYIFDFSFGLCLFPGVSPLNILFMSLLSYVQKAITTTNNLVIVAFFFIVGFF